MSFHKYKRQLLVTVILIMLWLGFALASPTTFMNARIYRSFMSTIPVIMILTLGMALLVTAGDTDMSFPSISAFSAFIFAWLYARINLPPFFSFVAAIFCGAFLGWINGVVVVKIGVPPIIATIGTQFLWRGLVLLLSDGTAIPLASVRNTLLHQIFVGRISSWGIPAQAVWSLLIAIVVGLLLNRHPFGEALLFTGDNRQTAEVMGIPVLSIRIKAFILMGIFSAFAGMVATLELNNWWPTQGEGYMLLVFAAVFVGGTSAYGGYGTIYGSFIGAIIIGIIEAGIVSAGLVGFWTRFIHGLVIIGSVSGYAFFTRYQTRVNKE